MWFTRRASKPPEFVPEWLAGLMRQGDWGGVHWHTNDQIRAAPEKVSEFRPPDFMVLGNSSLERNRALWQSMVRVADGPEFTDRTSRTERSRLFINRHDPQGLMLSLG